MLETVLFNDMICRDCNKTKYVTHHFTSEFCIKYISCKKLHLKYQNCVKALTTFMTSNFSLGEILILFTKYAATCNEYEIILRLFAVLALSNKTVVVITSQMY